MTLNRTPMKIFVLLSALSLASALGCSSSTETVQQVNQQTDQPIIYGFLQDIVGPGWGASVYGRHLEYCKLWLNDSLIKPTDSLQSNVLSFTIPQWATTDYVYAGPTASNRVRSPKPLVIRRTVPPTSFQIRTISKSTATAGDRIAIYGSRLLDKKDSLTVLFNDLLLSIDALTDDSIIVHLPSKTATGALQVIYQDKVFASFNITIVRPIAWRHLTVSIVGFEYTAVHRRTGYLDFQNRKLDSTWYEHATLDNSWTFELDGTPLSPNTSRFTITSYLRQKDAPGTMQLSLYWDTVQQYVTTSLTYTGHSQTILPVSITDDTSITFNTTVTGRSLDADAADSVMIPFSTLAYQPAISYTHAESDHNGEYSWTETSTYTPNPNYGLGRLILVFKP